MVPEHFCSDTLLLTPIPNREPFTCASDVRQLDGKWLRFDDAELAPVPLARVVDDPKAYLLFYQLRD